MKWPPFGDVLTHNMITALLRFNRGIPTTYYPLSNSPFYYPSGFHVLACLIADLTSLYIGESILIESGLILAMIIVVTIEFTTKISRTKLTGPVVALLLLWSQGIKYNTEFLFGYFLNGTYPFLLGVLGVILFAHIYLEFRTFRTSYNMLIQTLTAFVLLVTYPAFLVFISIPLTISIIRVFPKHLTPILSDMKKLIILSAVFICTLIMISPKLLLLINQYLYLTMTVGLIEEYIVELRFLLFSQTGLVMLFSFVVCIMYLLYRLDCSGNLIAILMSLPAIINVMFPGFVGIAPLIPLRSLVGASPLLYSYFITGMFFMVQILQEKMHLDLWTLKSQSKRVSAFKTVPACYFVYFMLSLMLIAFLAPTLYGILSFQTITKRCWLWALNAGFINDYKAAVWITEHEPNLKILVDYSQPSYQLFGFGIINTTVYDRDLVYILKHPTDIPLVSALISNANIKRIYLSSDWGFYDYEYKKTYIPKPFLTEDYIRAFSNITTLEFYSDGTAVLRVKEFSRVEFSPIALTETCQPNPDEWSAQNDALLQYNISFHEIRKSLFRYFVKGIFNTKPGYNIKLKYNPQYPIDLSNQSGLHFWYFTNQLYDKSVGIALILIDSNNSWIEYRNPLSTKSFRVAEWCPIYFSLENPYSWNNNFDFQHVSTVIIYLTPVRSGDIEFCISNLTSFKVRK